MLKAKMLGWVGAGLLSAALVPGLGYAKLTSRHKTVAENQTKTSIVKATASKQSVKPAALKTSSKGSPHRRTYRVSRRHASSGRSRISSRVAHHRYGKRHMAVVKTSSHSARHASLRRTGTKTSSKSAKPTAVKHAPVKKTSKKVV
jgi:hypothetical protein